MRASGQVVQVHDIPPFSACSSKRTGGFITRIALDECRARERYPARRPNFVLKAKDMGGDCIFLLDSCVLYNFLTKANSFRSPIPIAQNIEPTRPKRLVAGESPAGDTSFAGNFCCGCGSTAECGRAKAETTVRLRSPAPISFWGRSSPAERSFDMREAKRAALFAPTIFRGHSSASQSGCFTCIWDLKQNFAALKAFHFLKSKGKIRT